MKQISIHGLMRTGTNLVTWLLEHNYEIDVKINNPCWKHGPKCQREYGWPIVVTVRHPLSYLVSKYQRGSATADAVSSFRDWILWNHQEHQYRILAELARWSFAAGYWFSKAEDSRGDVFIVLLEDVLQSPERVCDNVATVLDAKDTEGNFETANGYIAPTKGSGDKTGGFEDIKRRLLDEKPYLEWYDQKMLEHVEKHTDPVVFDRLGYQWPDEVT